jgi:hypothetical protein
MKKAYNIKKRADGTDEYIAAGEDSDPENNDNVIEYITLSI